MRDGEEISLLCFVLLFFSSLFALMLISAVLVCSAAGCDAGALFQQMLADACEQDRS